MHTPTAMPTRFSARMRPQYVRIVISRDGSAEEQILGDHTSYAYQLAALTQTLQTGAEFLIDIDDSVANAELIDDVYRAAGLPVSGQQQRSES
jgi:hypothetical protein